jgi:hypothetical protein
MRGSGRAWGTAAFGVGLAIALAGCVPTAPMPAPTDGPPESGAPSAPPASRELNLQGTAAENLAYFNDVNRAWIKGGGATDGRSLIDNLVDSGFPKEAMEVTPDRTTVNAQADQVQYSVRINGTCLVGQYGGGSYNGTAQPLLASGKCLIGTTRPIDW